MDKQELESDLLSLQQVVMNLQAQIIDLKAENEKVKPKGEITLNIGDKSYKAFVQDVSEEQGRKKELEDRF